MRKFKEKEDGESRRNLFKNLSKTFEKIFKFSSDAIIQPTNAQTGELYNGASNGDDLCRLP